jgi:hypothetical protein
MDASTVASINHYYGTQAGEYPTSSDTAEFELLLETLTRCRRRLTRYQQLLDGAGSDTAKQRRDVDAFAKLIREASVVIKEPVRRHIGVAYRKSRQGLETSDHRLEIAFVHGLEMQVHAALPDGWEDDLRRSLEAYVDLAPAATRAKIQDHLETFVDNMGELCESVVYYQECMNRRTDAQLQAEGMDRTIMQEDLNKVSMKISHALWKATWWLERLRQRNNSYAAFFLAGGSATDVIGVFEDGLLEIYFGDLLCHES